MLYGGGSGGGGGGSGGGGVFTCVQKALLFWIFFPQGTVGVFLEVILELQFCTPVFDGEVWFFFLCMCVWGGEGVC